MAQRSISSFFFKGGGGHAPPPRAPAPDPVASRKRPRESADAEGADTPPARSDDARRDASPGSSDRLGAAPAPARASPPRRGSPPRGSAGPPPRSPLAPLPRATDARDPDRRDRMRRALGETVGRTETKRREVRERFAWLDPSRVRDAAGHAPGDPAYDARTCALPSTLKLSASQQQYWSVKSRYRDVVLFFKVGKFYELYEDDAEIGCRELDWKMTVSGVGHCRQVGCPESGVDAAQAELVRRGYSVGRVEQMETAAQAKARTGSKTAVIRRELGAVATPALVVDGDLVGAAGKRPPEAAHVMAFVEEEVEEELASETATIAVGYAALDAANGRLRVGAFDDDPSRGALATKLALIAPAEVLVPRLGVSAAARTALSACPSAPNTTALTPGAEFPRDAEGADARLRDARMIRTPAVRDAPALARRAVAALAAHLERLRCAAPLLAAEATLEIETGAAAAAEEKTRPGTTPGPAGTTRTGALPPLRLDAATLANLELLRGSDGTREGSLLARIDACVTPAGSRTLRAWLAAPLRDVGMIVERQDAVAALGGDPNAPDALGEARAGRLRAALRRAPDLQRCVGRARAALGQARAGPGPRSQGPGEEEEEGEGTGTRAEFELPFLPPALAAARHERRLRAVHAAVRAAAETIATLDAFGKDLSTAPGGEEGGGGGTNKSALLARIARTASAASLGEAARSALARVDAALTVSGKDASVRLASHARASAESEALDEDAGDALLRAAEAETTSLLSSFLEHAPKWSALANAAAEADVLAALATFALSAENGGAFGAARVCRPTFVTREGDDDAPTFDARGLWHPCAVPAASAGAPRGRGGGGVVPNDVRLGVDPTANWGVNDHANDEDDDALDHSSAPAMLLTGPNMGGKSTLLRAMCVAAVLAHAGAMVPAASLTLTPADVVHARLGGAGDRVGAGESTFLVECAEASAILRGATRDSIVVLDELGRGTSTFDGFAVAHAALARLALETKCRLAFATHYHALSRDFGGSPLVQLRHMAATDEEAPGGDRDRPVEAREEEKGEEEGGETGRARGDAGGEGGGAKRPIAFLYELRPGACPTSHGARVAELAGVPRGVIRRAERAAAAMEKRLARVFGAKSERALTAGERSALEVALSKRGAGAKKAEASEPTEPSDGTESEGDVASYAALRAAWVATRAASRR